MPETPDPGPAPLTVIAETLHAAGVELTPRDAAMILLGFHVGRYHDLADRDGLRALVERVIGERFDASSPTWQAIKRGAR